MLNAMSPKSHQLHHSTTTTLAADSADGEATGVKGDQNVANSASPILLSNSNHNHQEENSSETIPVTSSSSTNLQPTSFEIATPTDPSDKHQNGHPNHHHSTGPPHYVDLHVNKGECVSLQLYDGQERLVEGPTTITMITQQQNPPVPIPVQVPMGHMIHQIADQNGTLKHIILSLIDTTGEEAYDSTLINLPQGTFRVTSMGEIVSTTGGTEGDIPLVTLPQHVYFANIDGCPFSYGAPTLPDSLETPTAQLPPPPLPPPIADKSKEEGDQAINNNIPALSSNSQTTFAPPTSTANDIIDGDEVSGKEVVDISGTGANIAEAEQMVVQQNSAQISAVTCSSDITSSSSSSSSYPAPPIATANTTNPSTVANVAASQHNQELINGATMVPSSLITNVDGQIYGYTSAPDGACCCCCTYCNPAQDGTGAALVQPIPQEMILAATPADSTTTGANHRMPTRASGNNMGLQANGVAPLQYAAVATMMGPPIHHHQSNMTAMHPSTITQSISTGRAPVDGNQNGTMGSGQSRMGGKMQQGGKGLGGRGSSNGYINKHNKLSNNSSVTGNQSMNDRSYNSHYHQANHHSDQQQQHHHHHQPYHHNDGSSSSNVFNGTQKSHHSSNNYKGSTIATSSSSTSSSNYPSATYSSSYSIQHHHHHNSPSTATMASIVSSSINSKLQQQQTSPATYRLSEGAAEMYPQQQQQQRSNTRDQMNYNNSKPHSNESNNNNNNNNNKRINSDNKLMNHHYQQQHNNHHHHQHQNTSHNISSNRYNTSNVKMLANSSHSTIAATAVSPIRSRVKSNNSNSSLAPFSSSLNSGSRSSMPASHFNQSNPQTQYTSSSSNSSHELVNNKEAGSNSFQATQAGATSFNQSSSTITTTSTSTNTPIVATLSASSHHNHHHPHNQHRESQNTKSSTPPKIATSYASVNHNHNHQHQQHHHHQHQQNHNYQHHHQDNVTKHQQHLVQANPVPSSSPAKSGAGVWQGNNRFILQNQSSKKTAGQNDETIKPTSSNQEATEVGGRAAGIQLIARESQLIFTASDQQSNIDCNLEQQAASRASRGKQKKCQNSSNNNYITKNQSTSAQKRSQTQTKQSRVQQPTITVVQSTTAAAASADPPAQSNKSTSGSKLENANTSTKELENDITLSSEEVSKHQTTEPSETVASQLSAGSQNSNNGPNNQTSVAKKTSNSSYTESKNTKEKNHQQQQKEDRPKEDLNLVGAEGQQEPSSSLGDKESNDKNTSAPTNHQQLNLSASNQTSSSENNNIKSLEAYSSPSNRIDLEADTSGKNKIVSPEVTTGSSSEEDNQQINMASRNNNSNKHANSSSSESGAFVATTLPRKRSATVDKHQQKQHQQQQQRRGSNTRNEQKPLKLHQIPQLRILNLTCASVTSNSVQLRWSYNPAAAEKYNITQNHHYNGAKNNSSTTDHFVIESSSTKNQESNNLQSGKIVWQGCALSCRVNHLSSERIYHFKVRRTSLMRPAKGLEAVNEEHMVVSEILSVTLPSVQQHQQQLSTSSLKKATNNRTNQRGSSDTVSSLDSHHVTTSLGHHNNNNSNNHHNETTTVTTSIGSNNSSNRGNTSSHQSHSNHHQSFGSGKSSSQPIKFSNLFRQCRMQLTAMLNKLVQSSLSSCSDTKFAGLLLVLFTTFAMLLALIIHLYIVAPVNE